MYTAAATALAALGATTNGVTAGLAFAKYDVSKAIFLALFLDSAVTSAASAASFAISVAVLGAGRAPNALCTVHFLVMFVPLILGQVFNALIAVFRYACVRLAKLNRSPDEGLLLRILGAVVALVVASEVGNTIIHAALALPVSLVDVKCWADNSNGTDTIAFSTWSNAVNGLLLVVPAVVALAFSAAVVGQIKVTVCPNNGDSCSPEVAAAGANNTPAYRKVPVQASYFSALSVFACGVLITLIDKMKKNKLEGMDSFLILLNLLVAIRAPMAYYITFASNRALETRSKAEAKEIRLKKVREWAEKEKAERDANHPHA